MKSVIDLTGEWELTGTAPGGSMRKTLSGIVPGHVHIDLLREKHIPDPFWRDQAEQCQWVEQWGWTYERTFTVDDESGDWHLEFDGLDTYATITLNGTSIGTAENMFIAHRFPAGNALVRGENRLSVHFPDFRSMIEGKRMDYPCAFNTPERLHVRRMQCTFHWDWVQRFVSCGIWKPARLVRADRARLTDVFVQTKDISGHDAIVECTVEVDALVDSAVRVCIADRTGSVVSTVRSESADGTAVFTIAIAHPELWWPAGYGDQPLYRCMVDLVVEDTVVDTRSVTFGIRTITIDELADAPGGDAWQKTMALRAATPRNEKAHDVPGRGFIVRVNGERINIRGGNWVPCDPWPSRVTAEWYDRLLSLVRNGNCNFLRVWGGGIYEPEAFWERCNRYGILVSQDFMMACAKYPEDDDAFLERIRTEVPAAIRMLRNNPSLAFWCGNNENGMKFDENDPNTWGKKTADEIIIPACRSLDPMRPVFPTSPYGGSPNCSLTAGDCHNSWLPLDAGDAGWADYPAAFSNAIGRFNSECTTTGVPPLISLRKFLSEDDIRDATSPLWYYHTKDNPYLKTRLFDVQHGIADTLFGKTSDPYRAIRHLEYAQYEWVRQLTEAARRKQWYCSGIAFWMYNDCWPATGWSHVDYYGTPKAAWYAMKRASAPITASIEDAGDRYRIWVMNNTRTDIRCSCSISLTPWQGLALWQRRYLIDAPKNNAFAAAEIMKADAGHTEKNMLVCDLDLPTGLERCWHYGYLPHRMELPRARVRIVDSGDGWMTLVTDVYARVVTLAYDAVFSDNYFDMLPGETRRITWVPSPGGAERTAVDLSWWNDR